VGPRVGEWQKGAGQGDREGEPQAKEKTKGEIDTV